MARAMEDRTKLMAAGLLLLVFLGYTGYLYCRLPVPVPGHDSLADQGKMIWQQRNCGACHQLYGLGGFLGPDLTNVYSFRGPDYIRAFVISGNETMPGFNLDKSEMTALMRFLYVVDTSGWSDPRKFKTNADGTIAWKKQ